MKIPFSPPDITELEIEEVVKTLKSGWITTGPRTKELEKRFSGILSYIKSCLLKLGNGGRRTELQNLWNW